jgi:hypothetical protein
MERRFENALSDSDDNNRRTRLWHYITLNNTT